jgi:hypothetical protein
MAKQISGLTQHAVRLFETAERKKILSLKSEKKLADWLHQCRVPDDEMEYYVSATEKISDRKSVV